MNQWAKRTGKFCRAAASLFLFAGSMQTAWATDVTVSFVTERDGKTIPLASLQSLWKSPFGGWVVATWPFGLRLDDEPILEYQSTFEKLLDQSGLGGESLTALQELDFAGDLLDGEKNKPIEVADLMTFRFDRPSSVVANVKPGPHVITPGELRFTVKPDGAVETADPRLRAVPAEKRIEVLCHPVALRAVQGERSLAFPLQVTYGSHDLLGGLTGPIQEFEAKATTGAAGGQGFRRVTLYVPASEPGHPYEACREPFEVDVAGAVKAEGGSLRVAADGELHLVRPAAAEPKIRRVAVRWIGADAGLLAACSGKSLSSEDLEGSGSLEVPLGGRPVVSIGPAKGGPALTASLQNGFEALPYKTLVIDAEAGWRCWLAESASLGVRPGGDYAIRFTSMTGKTPAAPARLPVRLESLAGAPGPVPMELAVGGDGVHAGKIPSAAGPGPWRVVLEPGSPLGTPALGLVVISGPEPVVATVRTHRNRGVVRQGDAIDLFWTVRGGASAAVAAALTLKGSGIQKELSRVRLPARQSRDSMSGHVRLDTMALAPGTYDVDVNLETAVRYPVSFRVCQRDPVSDFDLYSYVFGPVKPSAGTSMTAFYDCRLANEPGLKPLFGAVDSGLDPAFAVYAGAPEGPVGERCVPLDREEAGMMALALLGAKAVPNMPRMLHHEEWNPKHSLPKELARMQRRLALFVQQYADVAGFSGVVLNWYATVNGYWEESKPLDGHQAERNAAAAKWVADMATRRVEDEKKTRSDAKHLDAVKRQAQFEFGSRILPTAYEQYLKDARQVAPGLTSHSGIPSFWLGGGNSYPPVAYSSLTHRDAVDYTDYGISPWGNFRAPAFLGMGNPDGQGTRCCFATHGRHARMITAFAAAGRGLDGLSLAPTDDSYSHGEDEALLRIFRRFGSYFSSLDPLPDVAVYYSALTPWANQKSVVLHDLARLRRPGMLLSPDDVLAGRLKHYRVLFLAAVSDEEPKAILDAFKAFEAAGGYIVKDGFCAASLPGRGLGFAYDDKQVHNGWGLAYPNGEWEFAHLWTHYQESREKPLLKAFEGAPAAPVSTSDREVVISPLAGKESICCFVVNMTYVPMSVEGKWRQHAALPRRADLIVQEGWTVHDLLSGKPCVQEKTDKGTRVVMDFSRAEGAIYLLTKREPRSAAMRTERTSPTTLRLTAWLADSKDQPLADPMPFEVTLENGAGETLFHKYAALGPERAMEVPIPALAKESSLSLSARDLVIGQVCRQAVAPAAADAVQASLPEEPDVIGRGAIREFLAERRGRVKILLDEPQSAYRKAAGAMAALLRQKGRDATIVSYDPAQVRSVPLRWKWQEEDLKIIDWVRNGVGIAWRVNLAPYRSEKTPFDDPTVGFAEYGPSTWIEGDVVLFGGPADSRAIEDLEPFLRRLPSDHYPSAGQFFVQYVWDPFSGGSDGLYLGCRDAAGAEAAVAFVAGLGAEPTGEKPTILSAEARAPVVTRGAAGDPLEDLLVGRIGTRVIDVAYSPSGNRVFATLDSYGDSLFVLNPAGEILGKRPVVNRCGNGLWWRQSGGIRPVSDTSLFLRLWDSEYLLDLDKGFVSRAVNPPHGIPGRFKVTLAGSTRLADAARGRTYLGGPRRLKALDGNGRVLWTYDDMEKKTGTDDLLYPRAIFVRALSTDGRCLLVSAMGIQQDCYGIGTVVNPSVFGIDTESGKPLWTAEKLLLNEGKVVVAGGRFVVIDDAGKFHVLDTATGREGEAMRPVGGTDWILPVPGRGALLVVENNRFGPNGPEAKAYVRPLGNQPDVVLQTAGRITDAVLTGEGDRAVLVSEIGEARCFSMAGARLWTAPVPAGGVARISPDGKTIWVGTREGRLVLLDMADGKVRREVDLNGFNLTSGEQFVRQMNSLGQVPEEQSVTAPPAPPEASYAASLRKDAVTLGANLIRSEAVLAVMKKGAAPEQDPATPGYVAVLDKTAEWTLRIPAAGTYLVELLAAAGDAARWTPQTRLEVSVTSATKGSSLPYVARLPLGLHLARRRLAFRTDAAADVVLSMRVIKPGIEGEGKNAKPTYGRVDPAEAPALVGDVLVAAMDFAGANLVLDQGPTAKRAPTGNLECEVKPWTGGNSTIRWMPYPAPNQALRLTDGIIANQDTVWTTSAKGSEVDYADGTVKFKKPQVIAAVAVYEDNAGPVPAGDGVVERTALRFGVWVRSAKGGQWTRVGYAMENVNLVNVFTFPPIEADQVRYFWAGRDVVDRMDGFVRNAEIEVYSGEDVSFMLDADSGTGEEELEF